LSQKHNTSALDVGANDLIFVKAKWMEEASEIVLRGIFVRNGMFKELI
jgi:hypothetical protein